MSSIYPRGGRLYFRMKVGSKWKDIRTEFKVGDERAATVMLRQLERQQDAGEAIVPTGPVTVAAYAETWLKVRRNQVTTWKNDETALRLHVLDSIGNMRLNEVRPHHLITMVNSWKSTLAPRSIYNDYSTVCALFRDACLDDLLPSSPCILTKRQLGPKIDKNPEWRPTALFTLLELKKLISDHRISMDRRVYYALEGLAGLRLGEVSGLHWRNCSAQPEVPPLGMLFVAFSGSRPLPKGDVCRPVPIHPTLGAILAEWKLFGWAQMMGRQPTPDDLVVPLPPEAKCVAGRWRRKGYVFDRFEKDLKILGIRHRRSHDLRRTFISLARSHGAISDILRRATHKPPTEVMEGYTTFEWEVVCREVLKLKIEREQTAQVVAIPQASAMGDGGFATGLLPPAATLGSYYAKQVALPGLEPGRGVSRSGF